jgi:hypothetical protein
LEQSYKVLSSAPLHELINEIDRRDVVVRNQTVGLNSSKIRSKLTEFNAAPIKADNVPDNALDKNLLRCRNGPAAGGCSLAGRLSLRVMVLERGPMRSALNIMRDSHGLLCWN